MSSSQKKGKRKILVTSALPYVNNVPHLGNIIGCVLSADVFARYCRSRGYETLYICGTDEHGTTTETKAIEEGVSPQEICDKYYTLHKEVYEWFNCSFDHFGRTSKPIHHRITKEIFEDLQKNGYTKKQKVKQSYCKECERFLADRFIEGHCPHCGYEEARGDQCESCGKLLNPTELKKPKCKICGQKPEVKESTHVFLRLDKLQPRLEKWVEETKEKGFWTENAIRTTEGWFKEGLRPRAISRDLKWGVQVPVEGFESKVFYVWFDAPIGYISITADKFDSWKKWWKADDVELYQFMAKDNIPFHTIIFPASLLGTEDKWTMLHHIDSTEYLNYEAGKFSKSRNIGVFGTDAKETGIPADVWRYYLLVNRPEKSDTTFTWNDFRERLNNELVANIGNFVNRLISFLNRFADSRIPDAALSQREEGFWDEVQEKEKEITELLEKVRLRDALKEILALSKIGNGFFQKSEPWRLMKKDRKQAEASLLVLSYLVKDLAILLKPFLPDSSKRIFRQLNIPEQPWADLGEHSLVAGHEIGHAEPLYEPIEEDIINELSHKFAGEYEEEEKPNPLERVKLMTAKVLEAKEHPDADKLYILTVDLGTEKRQLVAGLKEYYSLDELKDRTLVIVTNLKPAKLRGVYSQGMLLAAEQDGIVETLSPEAKPGTRVGLDGIEPENEPEEISFEEFKEFTLRVKKRVAHIEDRMLTIGNKPIELEKVNKGPIL